MVGSCRLAYRVALEPMAHHLRALFFKNQIGEELQQQYTTQRCVLNQMTFPALRFGVNLLKGQQLEAAFTCTSLIFATGRVIVTGCRTIAQVENALTLIEQICSKFPIPTDNSE
jgi:TATA-box binding protein (TBP) (component of TFIID and TFIIIB)